MRAKKSAKIPLSSFCVGYLLWGVGPIQWDSTGENSFPLQEDVIWRQFFWIGTGRLYSHLPFMYAFNPCKLGPCCCKPLSWYVNLSCLEDIVSLALTIFLLSLPHFSLSPERRGPRKTSHLGLNVLKSLTLSHGPVVHLLVPRLLQEKVSLMVEWGIDLWV